MTSPVSVSSSLSFGWKTFKARPWLFMGTVLIYAGAQLLLAFIQKLIAIDAVAFAATLFIGTALALGFLTFYLKAHDRPASAKLEDMLDMRPFLQYLVTSVVIAIVVILGLFALIVPGIILGIAFSMAPYLIVEKRLWTMDALKESWNLTKGNRTSLFLLALMLFVINFLGALPFMLGLLITVPVSMLAMAHAYRALVAKPAEPVSPHSEGLSA